LKALLISSFFPPVNGGSAVVYGNLHRYAHGDLWVLTARLDCQNNQEIINQAELRRDWQTLETVDLLRAPYIQSRNKLHSLFLCLRYDIPIALRLLRHVCQLIKQHDIKVLVIGELHSLSWCAVWVQRLIPHIAVVYYTHGEELTTSISSQRFVRQSKVRLQQADGVIAVSSFTRDELVNNWGIAPDKIALIANGVDLAKFAKDAPRVAATRLHGEPMALNEPTSDQHPAPATLELQHPYIFSVGRHIERKGFDQLIRAMAIVAGTLPEVRLYIGGTGPQTSELKAIVAELGLAQQVIFLGRLSDDELDAAYRHCHCFAMPNRTLGNGDTEGFGLVFLEANAYGKPVVAGRAGGAVDAVRDGESGFLVDGTDLHAIANALIKLFDPATHQRMSAAAYQFALANDVQSKAQQFMAFCQKVAHQRQARG
jgi:phosphatidylinositol alpha-1,6-mannosyltransferase